MRENHYANSCIKSKNSFALQSGKPVAQVSNCKMSITLLV